MASGWCCRFSRDGRHLAARNFRTARIYAVSPGLEFRQLGVPAGRTRWISISPDDRFLAAAAGDGVYLWEVASLRQLEHVRLGETRTVWFAAGETLFTSSESGLQRRPLNTNARNRDPLLGSPTLLATSSIAARDFVAAATDPPETLAFLASDSEARTLHLQAARRTPGVLRPQQGDLSWVAVSRDGRFAATASRGDAGVDVFALPSGRHLGHLPHRGGYVEVHFSPDGRWLVTNVRAEYRFWEVGTWTLRHRIPRKVGIEGAIAWTADGSTIALLDSRETVALYSARSLELLASLESPAPGAIASLCLTADGSRLFAALGNRIQCWDLRQIRSRLRTVGLDWEPPLP